MTVLASFEIEPGKLFRCLTQPSRFVVFDTYENATSRAGRPDTCVCGYIGHGTVFMVAARVDPSHDLGTILCHVVSTAGVGWIRVGMEQLFEGNGCFERLGQ